MNRESEEENEIKVSKENYMQLLEDERRKERGGERKRGQKREGEKKREGEE